MMKKFLLCLALLSVISSTATAKPFHRPVPLPPNRPAPIVIHDRHHGEMPFVALASGLIGFVAGAATATSTPTTLYTVSAPQPQQCFAVVSKSTGVVSQRCLSGDNQVLYVD